MSKSRSTSQAVVKFNKSISNSYQRQPTTAVVLVSSLLAFGPLIDILTHRRASRHIVPALDSHTHSGSTSFSFYLFLSLCLPVSLDLSRSVPLSPCLPISLLHALNYICVCSAYRVGQRVCFEERVLLRDETLGSRAVALCG